MKAEFKLHDYTDSMNKDWVKGEDKLIVRRPWNFKGMIEIEINSSTSVVVKADDLIEAIEGCTER